MFALLLASAAVPHAAQAQLNQVRAAVERYRDFDAAKAEGWKPFGGDEPLMGQHWFHPKGPDYVSPYARLDFARPSNLMYTEIDGRMVLTGVSFNVRLAPGERLPEGFAGAADRWHVHDFERAIAAATETRPLLRWLAQGWIDANYRQKGDDRGRVAMVHAWVTLLNPDGNFADHNRVLPYLKLGLPVGWARGASESAARGLHLATSKGCADTVDGAIWIADTGRAKAKALRQACTEAAAHVREGLALSDPARINAMAEHGWASFASARDTLLTAEQKARIAALSEHGPADAQAHAHHD
jgi:hypothetical protein